METFAALLAICARNSPVPGEFPTQRPVTRSFDVFFDLRLNKRLSKQWWDWWFGMLSRPLWRHRSVATWYQCLRRNGTIFILTKSLLLTVSQIVKMKISGVGSDIHFVKITTIIMGAITSQITSLTSVYSAVYSGANQRKHQSSASLAFVQGLHRWIPCTNGQ